MNKASLLFMVSFVSFKKLCAVVVFKITDAKQRKR